MFRRLKILFPRPCCRKTLQFLYPIFSFIFTNGGLVIRPQKTYLCVNSSHAVFLFRNMGNDNKDYSSFLKYANIQKLISRSSSLFFYNKFIIKRALIYSQKRQSLCCNILAFRKFRQHHSNQCCNIKFRIAFFFQQ